MFSKLTKKVEENPDLTVAIVAVVSTVAIAGVAGTLFYRWSGNVALESYNAACDVIRDLGGNSDQLVLDKLIQKSV